MENAQGTGKRYNQQRNHIQRLGDRDRVRILTNQSELHIERDIKSKSYRPSSSVAI